MITLQINGEVRQLDVDAETPLLWVLRDALKLTGTKFGCGRALCGACTVHLDGDAARSCSVMAGDAVGKTIVTIEGVSGDVANAVKDAWRNPTMHDIERSYQEEEAQEVWDCAKAFMGRLVGMLP